MNGKPSSPNKSFPGVQAGLSAGIIRQQLQRILNSPAFEATDAQKAFLRFVVEKVLSGQAAEIKGYTVAIEVFGRGDDFDQATDPVVSIHANKLRRALERYYLLSGQKDPIRIDMPKGGYVPTFTDQTVEEPEADSAAGIEDCWPCVLILPLKNLTSDPGKEHLGIGFAAELAVEVARFQEIKVLYPIEEQVRSGPTGTCRFVLGGSIYDTDSGIRITVHLTDMKTGQQIWGDTHSSSIEAQEILAFKEQLVYIIATKIAGEYGVIPKTMAHDFRRRPPVEFSTYDAILRYYEYDHTYSAESFTRALESLRRAAEIEPSCGQVWTMLAQLYANIYSLDYPGFEKPLEIAIEFAERGAYLCPDNQRALAILALVRFFSNELTSALMETERAIELNPNSLFIMDGLGYIMTLCGEWERGTQLIKKVMGLNPLYRPVTHYPLWLDCLRRRDFEGAFLETMGFKRSTIFWYPLAKAATLGLMGRTEEARELYKKLLDLRPDFPGKCRTLIERYIKFEDIVELVMKGLRKADPDEKAG
jgi:TolB-like protein